MSIVLSLEEEAIQQSEIQQTIIEANTAADVSDRVEGIAQGVADVSEIVANAPTIDGAEFQLVGIVGDMALVGTDVDPKVLLPVTQDNVATEGMLEAIKTLFYKRDHIQDRLAEMKKSNEDRNFFAGLTKQADRDLKVTYENPKWVEENLPESGSPITVRLLNTANYGGKALTTLDDLSKAAEQVMGVVNEIVRHEKPFIDARNKLVEQISNQTDPTVVDKVWVDNADKLQETAANRFLKTHKQGLPMIGLDPQKGIEWPVRFKNHGDFGFTTYFPLHKTGGVFEAPTKENAKHFAEVMRKLLNMEKELTGVYENNRITHWEDLNVAYDELTYPNQVFRKLAAGDDGEVSDLAGSVASAIERLIAGLYIAMFDKHQSQ